LAPVFSRFLNAILYIEKTANNKELIVIITIFSACGKQISATIINIQYYTKYHDNSFLNNRQKLPLVISKKLQGNKK